MNRASRLAIVALATLTVSIAHSDPAPNHYLCLVEHSAGLHYDANARAWGPRAFKGERKYIFRRVTDDDRKGQAMRYLLTPDASWVLLEFGDTFPQAQCTEEPILNQLLCKPVVSDASFDKATLRFEIVHRGSYINQGYWEREAQEHPEYYKQQAAKMADPDHPDDLFFEIGRCSPF